MSANHDALVKDLWPRTRGDWGDTIFGEGGTWFHWEDNWERYHGPFKTRGEALVSLRKYIDEVMKPK